MQTLQPNAKVIISRKDLEKLFTTLKTKGYKVIGPTLRDEAIVYDEISGIQDLPEGWTDEQEAGKYRLKKRTDAALFGYVLGSHSWKKFLFPPVKKLWSAKRNQKDFTITPEEQESKKMAFIGVRACELKAIGIQDKIFMQSNAIDSTYAANRKENFIVAVNCSMAGNTCFCASMNTGPKATHGFDLALTELLTPSKHEFLFEIGTLAGADLLQEIPYTSASETNLKEAETLLKKTESQMGRKIETRHLKEILYRHHEHPRWEEVAAKCLSCANCTLVCPTCFCSTIEDVTDLTGEHAERWSKWDSCFTAEHSYIHGGNIRQSAKSRYRQWITHKLATWHDQFGSSGCVGCGRCITWCPVGIDITEEAQIIRQSEEKK